MVLVDPENGMNTASLLEFANRLEARIRALPEAWYLLLGLSLAGGVSGVGYAMHQYSYAMSSDLSRLAAAWIFSDGPADADHLLNVCTVFAASVTLYLCGVVASMVWAAWRKNVVGVVSAGLFFVAGTYLGYQEVVREHFGSLAMAASMLDTGMRVRSDRAAFLSLAELTRAEGFHAVNPGLSRANGTGTALNPWGGQMIATRTDKGTTLDNTLVPRGDGCSLTVISLARVFAADEVAMMVDSTPVIMPAEDPKQPWRLSRIGACGEGDGTVTLRVEVMHPARAAVTAKVPSPHA